jgi:hypothetical protein
MAKSMSAPEKNDPRKPGNLGGPRPSPPARPDKGPNEAEGAGQFGGAYTDPSTVGWYPIKFDKVSSPNRIVRHEVKPEPTATTKAGVVPAPLD